MDRDRIWTRHGWNTEKSASSSPGNSSSASLSGDRISSFFTAEKDADGQAQSPEMLINQSTVAVHRSWTSIINNLKQVTDGNASLNAESEGETATDPDTPLLPPSPPPRGGVDTSLVIPGMQEEIFQQVTSSPWNGKSRANNTESGNFPIDEIIVLDGRQVKEDNAEEDENGEEEFEKLHEAESKQISNLILLPRMVSTDFERDTAMHSSADDDVTNISEVESVSEETTATWTTRTAATSTSAIPPEAMKIKRIPLLRHSVVKTIGSPPPDGDWQSTLTGDAADHGSRGQTNKKSPRTRAEEGHRPKSLPMTSDFNVSENLRQEQQRRRHIQMMVDVAMAAEEAKRRRKKEKDKAMVKKSMSYMLANSPLFLDLFQQFQADVIDN